MKAEQRAQYKAKLGSIDFFSLIEKSSKLSDHFAQLAQDLFKPIQNKYVVSFYPFEGEPQLNIEKEGGGEGFLISYVRISNWANRTMEARAARRDQPGQWEEFEVSPQNRIFQPTLTQPLCREGEIAMVLVPGVAFTKNGIRLGRGAGFYDRFLNQHPQALRVGIAFEEQIATNLTSDPWDEKLDIILTDQSIYQMKTFGEWKIHGKLLHR